MSQVEDELKPDSLTDEAKSETQKASEQLPFMLDFTFSVSSIVVMVMGILTTIISVFSGASLMMATIRGGIAVISVGFLLWVINWTLSRDSLEITRQELLVAIEDASSNKDVESTFEKEA